MSIINPDSYTDVPKTLKDYIDILYKHTWHITGNDYCYLFNPPQDGEAVGVYKVKNMHTQDILVFGQKYEVLHDAEKDQFILMYHDREWLILSFKHEPNFSTALLELDISENEYIRLNGTKGGDPLKFIEMGYF